MTDLDADTKLKMVREALEQLTDAVGKQQLNNLNKPTIEAYQKALGTLDSLKFVEGLAKKSA